MITILNIITIVCSFLTVFFVIKTLLILHKINKNQIGKKKKKKKKKASKKKGGNKNNKTNKKKKKKKKKLGFTENGES